MRQSAQLFEHLKRTRRCSDLVRCRLKVIGEAPQLVISPIENRSGSCRAARMALLQTSSFSLRT